jgi:uncharacterized protein (DUF58 family)
VRAAAAQPPPALLRALDLTVRRRVEGLLPGEHRGSGVGSGTEIAQVRPYVPGDDVRKIDWNVTARTREPHVRVDVPERSLTTWLLLDASASMAFGTALARKADVAAGVALAVGYLATRRGNRLGVVTFGSSQPRTLLPRQGRRGLLGLLAAMATEPEPEGSGATSLAAALRPAIGLGRRRGLVVLVTDFRGPRGWEQPMLALSSRHSVLAIEVRDPREQEIPDVGGELLFADPETGRQLRVDTRKRKLRERFAAAAVAERAEVARTLRRAGAEHAVVTTGGDWLRELAAFLGERSHRRGQQ